MAKHLSRRTFLTGVPVAAAAGTAGLIYSSQRSSSAAAPNVVSLFSANRVIAAGIPQRVPFALVDDEQASGIRDDDELAVTVRTGNTKVAQLTVSGSIVEHEHPEGFDPDHQHAKLFRYYPLRVEFPEPGVYDLELAFGSVKSTLPVQAFSPDEIDVLLPGEKMPALESATFDDPADVDTLCTRFEGPCPFHDRSVADLLTEDKPLAVLIATPALCSTAYCGPVLDILIEASDRYPNILMSHIEPYSNAAAVENNYADPDIKLAKAVTELGLDFEPSLFLVNESGIVVDRIDNVFDGAELDAALQTLAN